MINRRSTSRRGMALLMVLWVVVVSGLMLLGVMNASRVQVALAHDGLAAVQAHWLARAGVEQALAVLEEDEPTSDTQLEHWYRDPELFQEVALGTGTFSVASAADNGRPGLDDESARINLNVADAAQLKKLKTLRDEQIAHLLEWRKAPSGNATDAATSNGYYQTLRFPYDMRHADLQTHRELNLVQGYEDRKFFGDPNGSLAAAGSAALTTVYSYQPRVDANGKSRLNINSATAQQWQDRFNFTPQLAQGVVQARRPRFESIAALLDVRPQAGAAGNTSASANSSDPPVSTMTLQWLAGHADQMVLDNQDRQPGKININTASRDVLLTLPGVNDDISDRLVGERDAADGGFKTLGDVVNRHVLENDMFRQFFDRLTTRSDVFSVESRGVSKTGLTRQIFAVIDRGQTPMKILYWFQT